MKPRKQSDATKLRHARRELRAVKDTLNLLSGEVRRRRHVGGQASDILFNIGQHEKGYAVSPDTCATMRDVQKRWDAIQRTVDL